VTVRRKDGSPDVAAKPSVVVRGQGSKQISAAAFAALVGRDLRTLSNWDKAGITHPEIRRSRRYYGAADIEAVLRLGSGRKGAREGSPIKYLPADWDNDT